jgi:hypothetical protein
MYITIIGISTLLDQVEQQQFNLYRVLARAS